MLEPGSYLCFYREQALDIASAQLGIAREKLLTHPDFFLVKGEGSIGIDVIRRVGHTLRTKPIIGLYKVCLLEQFHLATEEAQHAFLKTFEEPPSYAYVFLVTPYVERLLPTIVSRAQILEKVKKQETKVKSTEFDASRFTLHDLLKMSPGERFLRFEEVTKGIGDSHEARKTLLAYVDAFLIEGARLLKRKTISLEAFDALIQAKWRIEQGFPNPRLLLERFLLLL